VSFTLMAHIEKYVDEVRWSMFQATSTALQDPEEDERSADLPPFQMMLTKSLKQSTNRK
jgi:hypothetical protein